VWQEETVAYLKVPYRNIREEIEGNYEKFHT
jgi:hypothetical protein